MSFVENNYSVIFLAAGYGTRLQQGINSSNNPKYDALKGVPKPLLPLFGEITLLDWWLEKIRPVIDDIYIVSNALHYNQILKWADSRGINTDNGS